MEEKETKTQETPQNTAAPCRRSSDLRTFCIALLTSIIVVALAHIAPRLCRTFCPMAGGACGGKPPVTYMLIPIEKGGPGCPMCKGMGHCGPGKPEFRHAPGEHRGDRHPGRPFPRKGKGGPKGGPAPKADAPAPAAADGTTGATPNANAK